MENRESGLSKESQKIEKREMFLMGFFAGIVFLMLLILIMFYFFVEFKTN
jgi:hypothetical protein